MSSSLTADSQGAWYTETGAENDVILSSRIRLARNLANFPFPSRLRGNDGTRIQFIVTDVFNHLENADDFQAICVKDLDDLGRRILDERGILNEAAAAAGKAGGYHHEEAKQCNNSFLGHLGPPFRLWDSPAPSCGRRRPVRCG